MSIFVSICMKAQVEKSKFDVSQVDNNIFKLFRIITNTKRLLFSIY